MSFTSSCNCNATSSLPCLPTGRIIHADSSRFFSSFFVTFENNQQTTHPRPFPSFLFSCNAGRIIHADNSGFFPSFFVTFENIRFTGGSAQGLGGAFFNSGKMQVSGVQWGRRQRVCGQLLPRLFCSVSIAFAFIVQRRSNQLCRKCVASK